MVRQCQLVVSQHLDIYIQRDLEAGLITEFEAQEMIDHLIMKLRMVKFARTPEYNHYSLVIQFGQHYLLLVWVLTVVH